MLAVEGYTILDVRGLITLHIFLGIMLLGPVLLKTGSTIYRFVRYYTGSPAYVGKGAPHIILRVLGPLVILSSLIVLGTGVALIFAGRGGLLLTAHKASFIVWFALMVIHVLGHIREAAVSGAREVSRTSRGQRVRLAIVALSLVAGVGAAAALLPASTHWTQRGPEIGQHSGR